MTTRPIIDAVNARSLALRPRSLVPNWSDLIAFTLMAALLALVVHSAGDMRAPLSQLDIDPVQLDPYLLPGYALRTTLRMFAAMAASLLFTFVVATLAAKSRKAEMVIVPALDILQSVPVLGFLTFTVLFFLNLFPGSQLGAECAAIFAIFTAQAWNMAFSFYQSLRTIPRDLDEVSRHFGFSSWMRFWKLEAPFAAPGLVWNAMMSMSGSWFFVVASEAISVGDTKITLPGIGAWLALAIDQQNIVAVAMAVAAIAIVILLYDQLVFRPVVAWADKFRLETTAAQQRPQSWIYDVVRRTRLLKTLIKPVGLLVNAMPRLHGRRRIPKINLGKSADKILEIIWICFVILMCAYSLWQIFNYISTTISWNDALTAVGLGAITLLRVFVLIAIASFIWVPIGVWIGMRPAVSQRIQPIAQFLAAFPANVLFPFAVVLIVKFNLDPNVWLSPLMVLGTQWYILFNVIAGASAYPTDLREVATMYKMPTFQWWRRAIMPGIFPYFVTGALTASGGSWNASIVAEVASWGDTKLEAAGLGAYIAKATDAGDFQRVVLGVVVMSIYVVVFNQLVWRPLYRFAERHFRMS